MRYHEFVSEKLAGFDPVGFAVDALDYGLFDHQDALVRWGLRRGRAAIFADTGLGKTRMHLAWADQVTRRIDKPCMCLTPLAVAEQTVDEGASIGVEVVHARDQSDVSGRIVVTNYDRLHRFDPAAFGAVVLDESSIIKHHDTKTLAYLLECFADTPYRLCATATPAPNDWTELGTHAEFLGICTRVEMLSEFFVHDGGETQVWRLKGHARHEFWRWVATWGAMIRSPADLGFDASRYNLPPIEYQQHSVGTDAQATDGMLFALEAATLSERRSARRDSIRHRVDRCVATIKAEPAESWIVWCELNAEADALKAALPDAIEVRGSDSVDSKERALRAFASGEARILITKPSIAGFGLNWQHCARIAFVGVTDSFESFYQAIRRCWRFGQRRPVTVHLFVSELEGAVLANLQRKERDALAMFESLSAETNAAVRAEVFGLERQSNEYSPKRAMALPGFMGAA